MPDGMNFNDKLTHLRNAVARGTIDNETYLILYKQLASRYGIDKVKDNFPSPDIKKVIFNPPATIVFWKDGTKSVVKAINGEKFDPEKGLALAITKKVYGNKYDYFDKIKKYTDKFYKKQSDNSCQSN
jgi:hypothetical protein